METYEQILKHHNSLDTAFTKFKNDGDNIIHTKHIIIDIEEIEDDFKHCYNCCLKCFLNRICCFLG